MMTILVFSENQGVRQELLSKARQTADSQAAGPVSVALLLEAGATAPDGADWGRWGADTVYTVQSSELQGFNPETYTDALAGLIEQVKPDLVLIGATKRGLEVAGRVAERLNLGCASWCVDFELQDQTITTKCMVYSGLGLRTYQFHSRPALVTIAPGVFSRSEVTDGQAEVAPVEVKIKSPLMTVVQEKEKAEQGRRLTDAPVIVDVGQGVKKEEDLAMVKELADLLNGQVACTRPISSERDWFPEWLGLSGAKLSPELAITVGVSGAIQHMIGIRDADVIVGINQDEGAAIFTQADYGVVANLYEFVPALIETLKSRSISKT
jgi:electron transfer flavoprotein alpha subunit